MTTSASETRGREKEGKITAIYVKLSSACVPRDFGGEACCDGDSGGGVK